VETVPVVLPIVLAMDGPSGSGKSSVSREVATTLRFRYLDTGAMYRAVTWWMLREGVDIDDAAAVAALAGRPALAVGTDPGRPTVVEGRDIGTVVAPDAPVKMFLTASADARATRRTQEILDTGENATVREMYQDMARRDSLDSSRVVSPLAQAPDAVLLDTTTLDKAGVVAAVLDEVRRTVLEPVSGTS
jgi:CMP/dCMP kinase